jgi:hypothetical protein
MKNGMVMHDAATIRINGLLAIQKERPFTMDVWVLHPRQWLQHDPNGPLERRLYGRLRRGLF